MDSLVQSFYLAHHFIGEKCEKLDKLNPIEKIQQMTFGSFSCRDLLVTLYLCFMFFLISMKVNVLYFLGARERAFITHWKCEWLCYACMLSFSMFHTLPLNSLFIMKQVFWNHPKRLDSFISLLFFCACSEATLKLALPLSSGESHGFGRAIRWQKAWTLIHQFELGQTTLSLFFKFLKVFFFLLGSANTLGNTCETQ